jgi:cytochrome P450
LIEEVLPVVYAQTRSELTKHCEAGTVLDLQEVFLDLTTKVMGQMAYDASFQSPYNHPCINKHPQMDISASSPFSKAFDYASDHIGLRFQNPLYFLTELFTGAKFRTSLAEVRKFGKKIVRDAKKRRSQAAFESLITNDDVVLGTLIDSLIETFASPTIVADAALNFLSAGRDTTAQSLTWTFYLLMRHPEAVDFVREEISTLAPSSDNKTKSRSLTVSHLQPTALPRTIALFYESLRLHPPVPFEIKQCETPTTLPDGTFLPRGALIVWCIWAMNRATLTFGDDAQAFRPERWLEISDTGSERLMTKTAFEFPVFNGGPRACLGKKMAELMAAWVVVRMLGEFEFEECRGSSLGRGEGVERERESQNSLTLPMRDGLPCRVSLRKYEIR